MLRTLVDRCLELKALEDANRGYLAHLESQLAEARAFQETMLPERQAELEGFEIHAAYQPCTELAGDLYDYAAAGPGRVTLLVADVVGHGATAAMLTSLVKSAFRASYPDFDPAAIVERTSEALAAFEADRFVTLLCARISATHGTLEYVNAGHDGGLVARPGAEPTILESTGPLVSPVLRDLGWERREVPWDPEAQLLLYSDGIPETWCDDEEMFEARRLRQVVQGSELTGSELLQAILTAVEDFAGGRPSADDMTLLTARWTSGKLDR